ncbi:MAG: hypothetical protein ACKO2P_05290, partial [Planctomycetota bacterium]
ASDSTAVVGTIFRFVVIWAVAAITAIAEPVGGAGIRPARPPGTVPAEPTTPPLWRSISGEGRCREGEAPAEPPS